MATPKNGPTLIRTSPLSEKANAHGYGGSTDYLNLGQLGFIAMVDSVPHVFDDAAGPMGQARGVGAAGEAIRRRRGRAESRSSRAWPSVPVLKKDHLPDLAIETRVAGDVVVLDARMVAVDQRDIVHPTKGGWVVDADLLEEIIAGFIAQRPLVAAAKRQVVEDRARSARAKARAEAKEKQDAEAAKVAAEKTAEKAAAEAGIADEKSAYVGRDTRAKKARGAATNAPPT